jgi:Icc protein
LRLGWLTDIHLNFVDDRQRRQFYCRVAEQKLDAVLLGGDIGEAGSVIHFLREMTAALQMPVYFVLGNHDFYRGSIAGVRQAVSLKAGNSPWLHWLSDSGVIALTGGAALVGHDSWADGRLGDFFRSNVMLNDYVLIHELRNLPMQELYEKLNALGDEAAGAIERSVRIALEGVRNIFVLTHVPPFRESCWHEGRISSDDYLPHFACRAVGDRLAAIMRSHPEHRMTVLCGHTHSPGTARILDNLVVLTGGAAYGEPGLQQVFDLE